MAWCLLAAGARDDPLRSPEVVWGTVGIALALLVGALAVWMMERWRKSSTTKTDVAGELTDYRGMYERGEITEDEYAKLRNRVAARVHAATQPAPAAPAGGAPAAPPGLPKDLADLAAEDEDESPGGTGKRTPGPDAPPPGPGGPANPPPPA